MLSRDHVYAIWMEIDCRNWEFNVYYHMVTVMVRVVMVMVRVVMVRVWVRVVMVMARLRVVMVMVKVRVVMVMVRVVMVRVRFRVVMVMVWRMSTIRRDTVLDIQPVCTSMDDGWMAG